MSVTFLLLGAPIEAKASLAVELSRARRLRLVDHPRLIRAALDQAGGDLLTRRLKARVEAGRAVPDELQLQLLRGDLSSAPGGVLLTGFPKTLSQAGLLDSLLVELEAPIARVLWLQLSGAELADRLTKSLRATRAEAELKVAGYFRVAGPLEALYRERGLLEVLDGRQPGDVLLAQALARTAG